MRGFLESIGLAKPKVHHGHVYRVVDAQQPTYYYAECDCGWLDVPIGSELEAFASVRTHTDKVDSEVEEIVVPSG